jgi:hypothetical protein
VGGKAVSLPPKQLAMLGEFGDLLRLAMAGVP